MTKRIGYILEKVADLDNLDRAITNSQKGVKKKKNYAIKEFNANREENKLRLRRMILELDFPEHKSRKLIRRADRGKIRMLDDEDYDPWKVMSHAIMQVIGPVIERKMITDTSSCIKGRGCLYGIKRLKKTMRRYPCLTHASKSDGKKYYQWLDPDYMEKVIRHHFKDERFIQLMRICVFDYYCGDEITEAVEREIAKKERGTNWRVHQRTTWEPRPRRARPHPHRRVRSEDQPELR